MPPRARAKVRAEASARQKELEETGAPLEVRQSLDKQIGRQRTIPTSELKNIIAATIQRIYPNEFGVEVDYANAREHYADRIVKMLKYGYYDEEGYLKLAGGITMRDHDFKPPRRCRKCRGES